VPGRCDGLPHGEIELSIQVSKTSSSG
jgi:hypothetical protein